MSIDALKKSAKKLHRALKDGGNLTLMKVQHHLAVSHGYKDWDEALTGPSKEFNDQDLHVVMAKTGTTKAFVRQKDHQLTSDGWPEKGKPAKAEKRVVLDNTGMPVSAVGLEDNEMAELKTLLDQAKSDPDFAIFTRYDVSTDDPEVQFWAKVDYEIVKIPLG